MKQTVIQELIQEMEELREDNIYPESFKAIDECIYLCYSKLEMEKEQIMNAWDDGQSDGATICTQKADNPSEEYYNKTFKSE